MTTHPSTCQCGGSGKIGVHPIHPLKMINECPGMPENPFALSHSEPSVSANTNTPTPSQEILEWAKTFRNRFGNYGLYENQGYAGYKDVLPEVESFISQLLSSHSQALQERHEAEIKRRREAMDYSGPQYTTQEVSEMGEEEKLRALSFNSGIQTAIAAFDHATHLNPKS